MPLAVNFNDSRVIGGAPSDGRDPTEGLLVLTSIYTCVSEERTQQGTNDI